MGELKATPGVWKQVTGIGYCCIRTGSMENKTGNIIADMRFVDGYYNTFDACLMAEAKGLYEALESALAVIESLPGDALGVAEDTPDQQGWLKRDKITYNLGRQLAKARGE